MSEKPCESRARRSKKGIAKRIRMRWRNVEADNKCSGGVAEEISFVCLFLSLVNDGVALLLRNREVNCIYTTFFPLPIPKTKSNNHLSVILSSMYCYCYKE